MNNSDTSHYENVPFEVPESWCWGNIMEVLVKLTDGTHHSPKNYPKGNYKYITAKNIKNEGVVLDGVTYVDDETHHEIFSRCNPEYGDILYIKDGATTGVVAINNLEEEFSLLSSVALLKPSKLISKKYLFYYLQSSYCYESVRSSMKGVGITRITLKQIADWEVPIPPIEEQHRIVEYIDSLFAQIDLIAKDTATLNLFLEKYKHGILNLAIAGKLVPQDPSDEHAVKLLTRINPGYKPCDNRHYENLPQNWEECALKDIVEIQNGYAFKSSLYSNDGVRVIRITNVQDGYIMDDSPKYYPLSHMDGLEDYMLKGNDLLMSLTGNVGRVAMMHAGLLPAALNQRVCCITPKSSEVCKEFLFYLLRTDSFITSCIESGKGVAQLNVSTEWLKSYRIALPPKDEQRRIVKAIQNIMTKIDKILADL